LPTSGIYDANTNAKTHITIHISFYSSISVDPSYLAVVDPGFYFRV
jgi:hypothetical protein